MTKIKHKISVFQLMFFELNDYLRSYFVSVFMLSVRCTYTIGYRKCSPFFFHLHGLFMAFFFKLLHAGSSNSMHVDIV